MLQKRLKDNLTFVSCALLLSTCTTEKQISSSQKENNAIFASYSFKSEQEPLSRAYAHNDYQHAKPLLNALENGFNSVEADIYVGFDNELYVAHWPTGMKKGRTLESLYLKPLQEIVRSKGSVYPITHKSFILMVDVKSWGSNVHTILNEKLKKYDDILTSYDEQGNKTEKAVEIILSGNRPPEDYNYGKTRYTALDGRFSDKKKSNLYNCFNTPVVSENWNNQFSWNGKGNISAKEKTKLQTLVKSFHDNGQQVRFWSTTEDERYRHNVWKELLAADVDYINTDHLEDLHDWLQENDRKPDIPVLAKQTQLVAMPK